MRDDEQQAPHLEELCLSYITTELCSHLISVSSSLKSLEITGIEDLMSLPVGMQHVSTLQTLSISDSSTLPDWIRLLTSLTELHISHCRELTSLPEEMWSLCNLLTLSIFNFTYLFERCQKETGEDWPKILHVPHIMIDNQWVTWSVLQLVACLSSLFLGICHPRHIFT